MEILLFEYYNYTKLVIGRKIVEITRSNQDTIEKSLHRPFVTALIGPRRVGKSTLIRQFAEKNNDQTWVHLNMDIDADKDRINQGELETMIIESTGKHIHAGEKIWVSIDEAQKAPALFNQIKLLYDTHKDQERIKFIITGSAVLNLHQLSAESLAGRVDIIHLYEFTLREAATLKNNAISRSSIFDQDLKNLEETIHDLTPHKRLLCETLDQQLIWGGLPEQLLISLNEENHTPSEIFDQKVSYLSNYLQTYLEKDVRAIESITDINLYRNMVRVIAEQTGSTRDDSKLKNTLGCHIETLKKYRGFLEATLFYKDIYPFINSSLKRLVKTPKSYLLNNGLMSILTRNTDFELLISSGMIGHRLENWFLNELNTWQVRQPLNEEVYFWQTSTGREVDFILHHKQALLPFEVTNQSTRNKRKEQNLKAFMATEAKAKRGYIVYRGDLLILDDITYLPAWAIA